MKRYLKIFHTARLMLMFGDGTTIAKYIKKHNIFGSVGRDCSISVRRLPIYPQLVYIHDNVRIASDVRFTVHDGIHRMLNKKYHNSIFVEKIGCIEIMNNVFVGSGCKILYNTRIGNNVIIGSGSLVNKDIPDNCVYAGVPARYICSFDEYVEKSERWSEKFKQTYGIDCINGVDDSLAKEIYKNFLNEKLNKE
ncbi:MAG: acyltransferase [Bacteroidaceae bacterium]|nr:acyltransferase [Bacteroidaceae bacterium]